MTVSLVRIRGTDCKATELGQVADITGGQVNAHVTVYGDIFARSILYSVFESCLKETAEFIGNYNHPMHPSVK